MPPRARKNADEVRVYIMIPVVVSEKAWRAKFNLDWKTSTGADVAYRSKALVLALLTQLGFPQT